MNQDPLVAEGFLPKEANDFLEKWSNWFILHKDAKQLKEAMKMELTSVLQCALSEDNTVLGFYFRNNRWIPFRMKSKHYRKWTEFTQQIALSRPNSSKPDYDDYCDFAKMLGYTPSDPQ